MAVRHEFSEDGSLVTFVVDGHASGGDLRAGFDAMIADPAFSRGCHALWDLRRWQSRRLPASEIRDLVVFLEARMPRRGEHYRSAMVVGSDVDYGVVRIYASYAARLPLEVRIFRAMEEARAWIASAPKPGGS